MFAHRRLLSFIGLAYFSLIFHGPAVHAADSDAWQKQLEKLEQKNAGLEEQLRRQQTLIDTLNQKVSDLAKERGTPAPEAARPEPELAVVLMRTGDVFHHSVDRSLAPWGLSNEQYNALRILRGAGKGGDLTYFDVPFATAEGERRDRSAERCDQ